MRVLALGIETKFLTDTKDNDFILAPKIGFGLFGIVNLFYGYNISFAGSPFADIGHNQFSLVCNLNGHILNGQKKMKAVIKKSTKPDTLIDNHNGNVEHQCRDAFENELETSNKDYF